MDTLRAKFGEGAERFIDQAISAGLPRDEAVAVLGIAERASVQAGMAAGEGVEADCVALARKRLEAMFGKQVHALVASAAAANDKNRASKSMH
ncbi:hypothetical protein [Paraburkholderia unamae]|uniref:Uncharacterized protein n=1 Tax=Paraburkholderia unamae TaxID=219649 RepID=A0ABX5KRQ3_9BURK|nr:hypothetical protein [Paraburkholderia unamae]PVX85559.1 hypothetical protein C7402_103136 [Paraburkholderia unamae]RAR55232.1 hypothetical protein C7401_1227 [Paraburkholderia unamae]CAG9268114.1 hypothetical protein PUN4_550169 [Paraburkholderia unamae]